MRQRRRCSIIPWLAVLAFLSADAGRAEGQNVPAVAARAVDSVRRYLQEIASQGFSGVVLVRLQGMPLVLEGYGYSDCEHRHPMTPEAIFDIGSITKSLTGAAVLALVGDGKISLGDSIGRFVSGVPADKSGITIEQLLRHMSGLPESLGEDEVYVSRDWLVEHALAAPLEAPPGQKNQYSNVGYALLGAIIEKVSGQSYEDFLRARQFGPAGLRSPGYIKPQWPSDLVACGTWGPRMYGATRDYFGPAGPSWHLMANGGIHSTIGDLARWFDSLLAGRFIPKDLTNYFATAIEHTSGSIRYLQTGGSNVVFTSQYMNFRDAGLVIVLFTNDSAWPKEKVLPGLVRRLRPLYVRTDSGG